MAQACESCFDNKTTQDGAEECSIFSPQEHRATNMTNFFNHFEDTFASAAALQVYHHLPPIIEKNCFGCCIRSRRTSEHIVCQMDPKNLVYFCFQQAFDMIDKERAEQQFRTYVYPKREFIYEQSWYEKLWADRYWMKLVQVKVVQLQQCKL